MPKITRDALIDDLRQSMGETSDVIFVMSQIYTFAHRLGVPGPETGEYVLDALVEAAGPDRTLVLPGFYYKYGGTRSCDLARDELSTGALPNCARTAGWPRSNRPMFGWLAHGPRAEEAVSQVQTTAYGADSVPAWLVASDARAIGVGLTTRNNGWIVVHRGEEAAHVPYRYYKRFPGKLLRDGTPIGDGLEITFAQPRMVHLDYDWRVITEVLEERGTFWVSENTSLPLSAVSCRDVVDVTQTLLARDPLSLLSTPSEAKRWIAELKDEELSGLKPEEQYHVEA